MRGTGNVRRTIYLSREADRVVRDQANRRHIGFSDVINEAILGGSKSAPGECWKMPEAPIGSVYLPSAILPCFATVRNGDRGYED